MLPDTACSCGSLMPRLQVWVPGKELGRATLAAWAVSCIHISFLQIKRWTLFLLFIVKVKITSGFLLVSENRYQCRSFVKERYKVTFQKRRYLCMGTLLSQSYSM